MNMPIFRPWTLVLTILNVFVIPAVASKWLGLSEYSMNYHDHPAE